MSTVVKVAASLPLNPIAETLARALEDGIDLERLSDLNMVRLFAEELRAILRGESPNLGHRDSRRLRQMGVIEVTNPRFSNGARRVVTQRGRALLAEVQRGE